MKCKHCGSPNTRKLSVIYQQETRRITTTTKTHRGNTHRTEGLSQSLLANRVAPPQQDGCLALIIGLLAGACMIAFLDKSWRIYGWGLVACCVMGLYQVLKFDTAEWSKQRQRWESSWHCGRCGEISEP